MGLERLTANGMIYRPLGRSGIKISLISFGTMRWQTEADCHAVIERGIELGLNYLDTSIGYVQGRSLGWCGAIARRHRDKLLFSCKADWTAAPDEDAVQRSIDKALKQAGLDYFDFYQMWGLSKLSVIKQALSKKGFVAGVRRAQERGLIRHGLGFTFHGDAETFRHAVDSGEFLSATVSYSLLNRQDEPLLDYAAARGVGTIIMNPLAGGLLANPNDETISFLRHGSRGPWHGALRFLFANPSVTTAIVGFADLPELEEDVQALKNLTGLTESYRRDLTLRIAGAKLPQGAFCTGCGYCRVCPHGIDPSRIMQIMRDFIVSGAKPELLKDWFASHSLDAATADDVMKCRECGICEKTCPQGLKITDTIRQAKAGLSRSFGAKT